MMNLKIKVTHTPNQEFDIFDTMEEVVEALAIMMMKNKFQKQSTIKTLTSNLNLLWGVNNMGHAIDILTDHLQDLIVEFEEMTEMGNLTDDQIHVYNAQINDLSDAIEKLEAK